MITPETVQRLLTTIKDFEGRIAAEVARAVEASVARIEQAARIEAERERQSFRSTTEALSQMARDLAKQAQASAAEADSELRRNFDTALAQARETFSSEISEVVSDVTPILTELSLARDTSERLIQVIDSRIDALASEIAQVQRGTQDRLRALEQRIDATSAFAAQGQEEASKHIDGVSVRVEALAAEIPRIRVESESNLRDAEQRIESEAQRMRHDFGEAMPFIAAHLRKQDEAISDLRRQIAELPEPTQAPEAPAVKVATLADLITGQGNALVPASVASVYIEREIRAAIARAKEQ